MSKRLNHHHGDAVRALFVASSFIRLLPTILISLAIRWSTGPLRADTPPAYAFGISLSGLPGGISQPAALALDGWNNLYVVDTGHNRVLRLFGDGTYLTQFGSLGSGPGQFSVPLGVAVDSGNNIYVTDQNNARVESFSSSGAFLTQWGTAGSGNGQFSYLRSVAVDPANNVYIGDDYNHRVESFTTSGLYQTQWGVSGPGTGQFFFPLALSTDGDNNVYVWDANNRIQKFGSDGTYALGWGLGTSVVNRASIPNAVSVDSATNLYVADRQRYQIRKFNSVGTSLTQWGTQGVGPGQFTNLLGVAVEATGNLVYVLDGSRIEVFTNNLSAAVPVLYAQPSDQTLLAGATVSLRVSAFGATPFSYQWLLNSTNLDGATNSSLTVSNIMPTDSGVYAVVVTNSIGSSQSRGARLSVFPAVISNQPVSLTLLAGSTAAFSVGASALLPLAYQWSFNGTNLPGATSTSLTLSNVMPSDVGPYAVQVTDGAGGVWSSNAVLTVLPAVITNQPASLTVLAGSTATFSVGVSALLPLAYQWTLNGANLPGATNASLTLSNVMPSDAGPYAVQVTDGAGGVWSSNAMLTILPAVITNQPASQTVLAGSTAIFTVGVSAILPLNYQWTFNGTNLLNATNAILVLSNVVPNESGAYAAQATDDAGSVSSSNATLSVVTAYAMTLPANGISTTGATLNGMLQSAADGTSAWFEWGTDTTYGKVSGTTNLPGITGAQFVSFPLSGLDPNQTFHYHLVVSNSWGMISGADKQFALARRVLVWGDNANGQATVPYGLNTAVAVAGGGKHSLALKNDGTVAAWGDNSYGQITIPGGLSNVVAIAAGQYHNLALKGDGTVAAWGNSTSLPGGLTNVVCIAAGTGQSLALKNDGTVVAWGNNSQGQGVVPPGLSNVVAIGGGDLHSIALRTDGTVVVWGDNSYGQANLPPGLTNVVAIAPGWYHNLALRSDGTVAAWGYNSSAQATVPLGLSNVVALSAGFLDSLALKADGTVVYWGSGTAVPTGLTNVVAIASGYDFNLSLGPTPPEATTLAAIGITTNNVNLDATVDPGGSEATALFQWGTTTNYGNLTAVGDIGNGITPIDFTSLLQNLSPNMLYHFRVVASNSLGTVVGADSSFIMSPPFITVQPQSQMVYAGIRPTTFSVGVGGVGPFAYQWLLNGTNPIIGATASSYTIASPQSTDAATYSCSITTPLGSTNSANATLTVLAVPTTIHLSSGLVVHLKFDGDYLDYSGRGNNATNVGATTFVTGRIGPRALHYSESSSGVFNYATLGVRSDLDFSSNVNFSVAFWVRSTTLGSLPFIANTPSFSYGGYNLSPNGSGGWHWSLQDAAGNTAQASGTNQLSDGSWHHLAFTFDRQGSGATYIDGAQVDSRPIVGLLGRIPPNRMCIGQNAGGSYTTFNPAAADIDDVGLWRRVLMPFEVTGIYLVGASNGLSFVSAPVTLSIQPVGNNVQLIWSGGLLQSADDVAGPYVDVPGATTPYTVMPSALKKFYRIRE